MTLMKYAAVTCTVACEGVRMLVKVAEVPAHKGERTRVHSPRLGMEIAAGLVICIEVMFC